MKHETAVARIWRGNGRRESTIRVYLGWGSRFQTYCDARGQNPIAHLTLRDTSAFVDSYVASRKTEPVNTNRCALVAMKAWSFALQTLGQPIPEWGSIPPPLKQPAILREYGEYRGRHSGVVESTVRTDQGWLALFLDYLGGPAADLSGLGLSMIDEFVVSLSSRLGRRTVARICTSLRSFLRFLHATGRLPYELASSVKTPVVWTRERPPRSIPWSEIRTILRAIERSSRTGCRDYALLLTMATYGMGAAEVLSLRLDDVDWSNGVLHVKRPKTGAETFLPLLPAVGQAIVDYLLNGRPRYTSARQIFVSMRAPHGRLSSSAICHILRKHAEAAGIQPRFLGSHVLRHSHASFQVDHGAPPQVVSDILGHRDFSSTSAYIRVATNRLRAFALPVPSEPQLQ